MRFFSALCLLAAMAAARPAIACWECMAFPAGTDEYWGCVPPQMIVTNQSTSSAGCWANVSAVRTTETCQQTNSSCSLQLTGWCANVNTCSASPTISDKAIAPSDCAAQLLLFCPCSESCGVTLEIHFNWIKTTYYSTCVCATYTTCQFPDIRWRWVCD